MQKAIIVFIAALFAQGAFANKATPSYSNIAVAIAETGASASWAAKETLIAEQNARKMEEKLQKASNKMNMELEQRFNAILEAQTKSY